MTISSIEDLARLVRDGETDWQQHGDVRAVEEGDLVKLCYTRRAQWKHRWSWLERAARGIIFERSTGALVAWPFEKFFNWGEGGRTTDATLLWASEKMDGSLGIVHREVNGRPRVTTKGAFSSPQAIWATEFARRRGLRALPDMTLMVEIIYPDNRIVVDYGEREALVLIGARCHLTGRLHSHKHLEALGRSLGYPVAPRLPPCAVSDLLRRCEECRVLREGWVGYFSDGSTFKFKTRAYMETHRVRFDITPARIAKLYLEHGHKGVKNLLTALPEREAFDVSLWASKTAQTFLKHQCALHDLVNEMPSGSRKNKALWIQNQQEKYRAALFAHLSGKPTKPLLKKITFAEMERHS